MSSAFQVSKLKQVQLLRRLMGNEEELTIVQIAGLRDQAGVVPVKVPVKPAFSSRRLWLNMPLPGSI